MNQQIEYRADILRALGEPIRLKIIESLRDGGHCACEIVATIGEEQPSTYCHLNQMLASGLLSRSRDRLKIYYAIKHPQVLAIADLVTEVVHREHENALELDRKRVRIATEPTQPDHLCGQV